MKLYKVETRWASVFVVAHDEAVAVKKYYDHFKEEITKKDYPIKQITLVGSHESDVIL